MGIASTTIPDTDFRFIHRMMDLIGKPTPIHKKGLTRDITRSVGGKIEGSPNDFFRFAKPTHGRSSKEIF
jgi:hypothetical protein